jgi:osmotically-inducible protein OsmY
VPSEEADVSDDELRMTVANELVWDPRVDDQAIVVLPDPGEITLRGTVGSFREKREAATAAKRVAGVEALHDGLKIRILDTQRRDDADLRGAVLQALALDSRVPSTIDAKARDGVVTLTGWAPYNFQRDEAKFVAGNVAGVTELHDKIELAIGRTPADDVRHSIEQALERDARLDANALAVDTEDGTVTLSGCVRSWAEHDAAVAAAWAAPGVAAVRDLIVVAP